MREYVDNGARLGWLIDPVEKLVWVYRQGASAARLDEPPVLSGHPEFPSPTLRLASSWSPGLQAVRLANRANRNR